MGALALTTPARSGTVVTGAAVAASDTISRAVLGRRGVILEIINGNAASDTVTVSDASLTKTGAAATAVSKAVANGTSQVFRIKPEQATTGPSGGVTITHSVTSTVTYKMYPVD